MAKAPIYRSTKVPAAAADSVFSLAGERRRPLQIPSKEGVFQTVDKALDVIDEIDERIRQARQVEQVTDADTASARHHADFIHRIQTDAGYADMSLDELEAEFDKFAEASRARILSPVDDHQSSQEIGNRIDDRDLASRVSIRDFGRRKQIDRMRAKIDAKLSAYADGYVKDGKPEAFAKVKEMLDGHEAAMAITATERGELERKFKRETVVGRWQAYAQLDPLAAQAAFEKNPPGDDILDTATYAALKKYIQDAAYQYDSRVLARSETLERKAEARLKKHQAQVAGGFWAALRDGKDITPAQLDVAHTTQDLSLTEYKALRKAIAGDEGAVDDWAAVRAIEDAFDAGADAVGMIDAAVADDLLKIGTAMAFREKNRVLQSKGPTETESYKLAKMIQRKLFASLQHDSLYKESDAAGDLAVSLRLTEALIKGEDPLAVIAGIVEERSADKIERPQYDGTVYPGDMTIEALTAYKGTLVEMMTAGTITQGTYDGMFGLVTDTAKELQALRDVQSSLATVRRGLSK